jgi:xyloglucan-specific exo-beta-1,4-glucanase
MRASTKRRPASASRAVLATAASLGIIAGALAAAAPASADSAAFTWSNVKIGAGGFITGVVFNQSRPGLAYLRTDIGGLYRWDAPSRTWIPLLDWTGFNDFNQLGVESVATSPLHPNRVWAAVGEYSESWNAANKGAILRSDDYGRHWKITRLPILLGSNDQGRDSGERLAVDPNDDDILYFASRDNGLWKSTDGGVTWAQDAAFPDPGSDSTSGLQFVAFDQTESHKHAPTQHIVVGDADKSALYETIDGGATWSAVSGGPGTIPIKAQFSGIGSLYVVYDQITGPYWMGVGKVYKYARGAGSEAVGAATDVSPPPSWNWYGYDGLAVDPQNPNTVIVSTNDRWNPIDTLYRSTDGGATWKDVSASTTLDISDSPYLAWGATPKFGWWIGTVAIDPFDSNHVVYGTGATLYGTDDLGALDTGGTVTFSSLAAKGIEETAVNDLLVPFGASSCRLISAVGDLGGFCHTSLTQSPSTGMSANPILSSGTGLAQSADGSLIARVGFGGNNQFGAYSTDGGSTWTPFTKPANTTSGGGKVAVSADGKTIVWSVGDTWDSGVGSSYSTDDGQTWTAVSGLPAGLTPVADAVDPSVFYAIDGSTGTFYKSADGGKTFTATSTSFSAGSNTQVKATPGKAGDLWLSGLTDGLFHSADGGATWTKVTSAAASYTLGFGKAAPGSRDLTLYQVGVVNGITGIFMSTNDGATWKRINRDDQNWGWTGQAVTGDPHTFGRVYLATNGRGIQTVDIAADN